MIRLTEKPPEKYKELLILKEFTDELLEESEVVLKEIKEKNLPDCTKICTAANHVDKKVTLLWR